MANPSNRDLELNELGWMSNVSDVKWFGENCYMILSPQLREYWFNRAGFLECDGAPASIPAVEEEFQRHELPPHFFVQDSCRETMRRLTLLGYAVSDAMSVLTLERPTFLVNPGIRIETVDLRTLEEWIRVYLLSFYGELSLKMAMLEMLGPVLGKREVTLLSAKLGEESAGVVALCRTPGVMGAYSLGTLPSHRRTGVAGTLLERVRMLAEAEERKVVLQTIMSDGFEGFYVKAGFRRRYLKQLFRKGDTALDRDGGGS